MQFHNKSEKQLWMQAYSARLLFGSHPDAAVNAADLGVKALRERTPPKKQKAPTPEPPQVEG